MRRRPGVTAAPTTAAFATGDGPGLTAAVTTAALATGAPTTPTRPTRAARRTMSRSRLLEGGIRFERGDDRLDRDAPVGDQLSARATRGRGEVGSPDVLVDEHPGDAARLHRIREALDVVGREQLGQLGLDLHERAEFTHVGQLDR